MKFAQPTGGRWPQIANHPLKRAFGEPPRTTKLYDHTSDAVSLDERACPAVPGIKRILI